MPVLTEKQSAVLEFIENYQLKNGRSPTLREMREHFQVSSDNSILKHLKALEEKGCIEKDDSARGIKPLSTVRERLQSTDVKLPLVGLVPAGGPVLSEENIETHLSIGRDLVSKPKNCFLLQVKGDSMINAGINDGDLVIADRKKEPRLNDIIIALIDNENTVKRLVGRPGKHYLKAENPKYPDIHPENDLQIQGVVTGLIRSY